MECLGVNAEKLLVVLQLKVTSVVLSHGKMSVGVACSDTREGDVVGTLVCLKFGTLLEDDSAMQHVITSVMRNAKMLPEPAMMIYLLTREISRQWLHVLHIAHCTLHTAQILHM